MAGGHGQEACRQARAARTCTRTARTSPAGLGTACGVTSREKRAPHFEVVTAFARKCP